MGKRVARDADGWSERSQSGHHRGNRGVAALATAGVAGAVGGLVGDAAETVFGSGLTSDITQHGGTLSTTFHHPFYDITQAAFVDAQNLKPGDDLQTPTGEAVVTSVRLYHANTVTYDLTIGNLHTYYVLAGSTPVLVHNCTTDEEGTNTTAPEPVPTSLGGTTPAASSSSPQTLFHYTDDAGSFAIQVQGRILPMADGEGSIFLSPDAYSTSEEARSALAMTRVRPTGYFEIPMDRIQNLNGPFEVRTWPPGSGGGGTEYWTQTPIDVSGLPWIPFEEQQ